MGLFQFRTPHNQNVRRFNANRRATEARRTINEFADCLSEHGDVPRASKEIGVSASYGRVLLGRIKAGLGWQAI